MGPYRLLPDICIERFDDQAVLFVAEKDRLITVSASSADLYEKIHNEYSQTSFVIDEIVTFICSSYQISTADALAQVRRLLGFGLRHGLVSKSSEKRCPNE